MDLLKYRLIKLHVVTYNFFNSLFFHFVYFILLCFSVFVFKDLLKNEQDQVPKEISQKYYISRVLGQGACGLVKLVYNKV